jgi:predicted transcriptional regulator
MENYNELINYIETNIDNTHTSIANLLKRLYSNKYCVTTDNNKDKWFRFNGTHWESSNAIKHELKNKLSSEVVQIITDTRSTLRERIMEESDEQKSSFKREKLKMLLNIEKNLYNTYFKDSIIKECESVFYQEKLPNTFRT